jgi:hypothetical protein
MPSIPNDVRLLVRERAKRRCEYCQTQERVVIYMEVDHIIPVVKGGASTLDNLCYCCRICNTYKHDHVDDIDPETGTKYALYNPRQDNWADHFYWEGTVLAAKTAVGRVTIHRLQINRELNRESRKLWIDAGWHPPSD